VKRNWKKMVLILAVDRSNPPVEADLEAPAAVTAVLRTACYDCHSNETHWPWYSYVAPVSWLVARDVEEARSEFSFSRWDQLDTLRDWAHPTPGSETAQNEWGARSHG